MTVGIVDKMLLAREIIMSKSHLYQTKPIGINSIKREAKTLKKTSGLSHTEALDVVAKKKGFNHYHHAIKTWEVHLDRVKCCTKGIILIYDCKEGDEFHCDDSVFKEEDWLEHYLKPILLESLGNELYPNEHESDGKTMYKDVVTKESIESEYHDTYHSSRYFCCTQPEQFITIEELNDAVRKYCFWGISEIIINGKYINYQFDHSIELSQKLKDF